MDDRLEIGSVVYSKLGRDSGKYYVVVTIEQTVAYIADGSLRKLSNPKRKNVKHLKGNGQILESIAQKFKEGKKVFDSEVKSALRTFNENNGGNNV